MRDVSGHGCFTLHAMPGSTTSENGARRNRWTKIARAIRRFPGEQLERDENSALLERALSQLPEEKRELLVLARYKELKYEEIAELLEVSVGAVKVRVHRAVKDLRNIFLKLSNREESCIAKKSETSLPSM